MVKKKVDARVRTLIENCIQENYRSFFVLVGDHGKDQIVNLHYIQSKAAVKARPSVLWCYKKELGFSTHKQKRMQQIKKKMARGLYDPNKDDPFELFVTSTDIRWCYYKETHKILGSTFGMCVLQDFEAITPNIMARTIETVQGGGIVVLLLRTMSSLKQLYTMSMDVHDRFRTESHHDVVARFNERFILSLSTCARCLVLDDELNVLPVSKHMRKLEALPPVDATEALTKDQIELNELKSSLRDSVPVGVFIDQSRTLDQAKAILTFVEAISEKTLRSTVALTASRGRGKSAAIGLALAASIAYGYSNVFVTAPSPENLKTVFEFIFKGFDGLQYKEHLDYDIIQSTNPEFHRSVIRVNIFREHRQTIQYISPNDHQSLAQAELLAIDEAAAIPLPLVRKLMGPYVVFLSSTVNGYEGTGRSLSLKLIQKLREEQTNVHKAAASAVSNIRGDQKRRKGEQKVHEERWQAAKTAVYENMAGSNSVGRTLREVTLELPIRYAFGDPVEKWLNNLLCLDATNASHRILSGTPHPKECELFYVNRDSLFSFHTLSESFLQRIMALYVSSHYKNQPNDLQLLSDAPAHHIFVLLGPSAEAQGNAGQLPDVLCVVQVALEGEISIASINSQLSRGHRASGDLIPWTISQQFQDSEFGTLSGARIVRIATHPDVTGMGYGSRAIELLTKYYQGDIQGPDQKSSETAARKEVEASKPLQKEKLKPRKDLPPLLLPIDERACERLHWLGTSFGLTAQLHKFWSRSNFHAVYLRQTANDLTGEHTAILLHALRCNDLPESPAENWLSEFARDARRRFISLLSYEFAKFPCTLSLSLLTSENDSSAASELSVQELESRILPHDLKRLQSYAKNLVDYHMIVDLLPSLSQLYFTQRFPLINLSYLQRAILVTLGLQHHSITRLEHELGIPSNQLLALFNKAIRKFVAQMEIIFARQLETEMESEDTKKAIAVALKVSDEMVPVKDTLRGDMEKNGEDLGKGIKDMKEGVKDERVQLQKKMLESLDLMHYVVKGSESDWKMVEKTALKKSGGKIVQMEKDVSGEAVGKRKRMKKEYRGKKGKRGKS